MSSGDPRPPVEHGVEAVLGGYLPTAANSLSSEDRLLNQLIDQFWGKRAHLQDWYRFQLTEFKAGRLMEASDSATQARVVAALVPRLILAEERAERYRASQHVDVLLDER